MFPQHLCTAYNHALTWALTVRMPDPPACDTGVNHSFKEQKLGIYYLKAVFNMYLNWFWRVGPWFIGPVGGFQENPDAVTHSPELSPTQAFTTTRSMSMCLEILQRYRPIANGLWHCPPLKSNTSWQLVTVRCMNDKVLKYVQRYIFKDQGAHAPQERPLTGDALLWCVHAHAYTCHETEFNT